MGLLNIDKQLQETCIICDQSHKTGIHLYTSFICIDCEKSIISTDPSDPHYKFFLKKLKYISTEDKYL